MLVKNLITLGVGASPGSIAPFVLLGLGVSPGSPSPATLLDVSHAWQFMVDGTDRWQNTIDGSLAWTEYEAGEIGTLRATLKETGAALGVTEWQEVVLKDGSDAIWGGYIVNATPLADRMGNSNRLTWEITAESYATILNRTPRVHKTWHGSSPGAILADLFDLALDPAGGPPAQTEFDTSTYVSAGAFADEITFTANGEKLTDILDRLALLAGFVWWIDPDKAVHFGAASASTAPFGVKLAGAADYVNFFPPNANSVNARIDATDIRNRVTVNGGVRVSAVQTDNFTGDGSTLVFTVSQFPIVEIVSITVGGVVQSFGTDWYHSFDDYNCLVNYSHGTVRWDTGNAPPNLDAVVVKYRYGDRVAVTISDATSITQYGRAFDYEVTDNSISTLAAATAVANAILDEYAYGILTGGFEVNRLGIKAGQRVQIEYTALGLTGYYQARQVAGAIRPGGLVTLAVRFGGKRSRLSNLLQGNVGGGPVTTSGGSGGGGTSISPGAIAKDQYGLQLTAPDYGSNTISSFTQGTEALHIRFKDAADEVLHRIEAWTDTSGGALREVLMITSNPADELAYVNLRAISIGEAWLRLRAVGGYNLAGQQDASINVYAYKDGGDFTRINLGSDLIQLDQWTGASAPDPGTGAITNGMVIYTDGTWDPGEGEGLYARVDGAWVCLSATHPRWSRETQNSGNFTVSKRWTRVSSAGGAITATLPTAASAIGRDFTILKVDASGNAVTVDGDGAETINGAANYALTAQWQSVTVNSNGSNWEVIGTA